MTSVITFLLAEFTVDEGWGVGAVTIDDTAIDRELLLDVDDQPWVPGSSLAGSLRAHLRSTGHDTTLMGSPPPTDGAETTASPLWLLGTTFTPTDGAEAITEVVGQTAINRVRGAAEPRSLRYSRMVGVGGTLTAYLRLDGELSPGGLRAIAQWRPWVGHSRTAGNGRARLTTLRHGVADLSTRDGLLLWFGHDGPALVEAVATTPAPVVTGIAPQLTFDLSVEDALLVGDPRPTGPARSRRRGSRSVIPGSAWKGLFRSRIEYILRSRYGQHIVCSTDDRGCGTCPVCQVFGHSGRRGRLAFLDSTFDTPQPAERTHVGIDRVTGSARDGVLFTTAPVTSGRLTLRIEELEPVPDWVHNAIRHVLRDLDDALIGVGSRVSRGMGTLRLATPLADPGPVVLPDGPEGTS